jgi:hypothetical protein
VIVARILCAMAITNIRIKRQKHGVRLVSCAVDGRHVEPFYVYPEALEMYKSDADFVSYLERSARGLLQQFGDKYGRRVA